MSSILLTTLSLGCLLLTITVDAAKALEYGCPYVAVESKKSLELEINDDPPFCKFIADDRLQHSQEQLDYTWLLAIPIAERESVFLAQHAVGSTPMTKGQWNALLPSSHHPACYLGERLLIIVSGDWSGPDVKMRIVDDAEKHLDEKTLKPFAIPTESVWKQVQELSPGSKFDIMGHEAACMARELEGRKFIGSTFGDFNGDGRTDIVFNTVDSDRGHTLWIFHGTDGGFDLIVRRKKFSAWVSAFRKANRDRDTLSFAGGCDKGDPTYLEFDTKTGKYLASFYPYEENDTVAFESGVGPE